MPEIIIGEEHSQVYDVWKEREQKNLVVSHVDFHGDMRGFVINREKGLISFMEENGVPGEGVDSGNFLGHAVMEGIVNKVRWIHDKHGGRDYDAGTVKYTSDLSVQVKKLFAGTSIQAEKAIDFEVLTLDEWDGELTGHQLDIDWDGLASIDYDLPYIKKVTDGFLAKEFSVIPETTFLIYSPGYSYPDQSLFEQFIERLADKFSADVHRLPPPKLKPGYPKPPVSYSRMEQLKHNLVLRLHKFGIH